MNETKKQDDIAEENSTQNAPVNEGEQTLEVKADAISEGGEQPNQDRENSESSTYNLILGAVCFSVAAIALAAWSLWGNKPEQYRVVDLAEISKFYQEQAREQQCARLYWHTQETNLPGQKLYNWIAEKPGVVEYRMPL